MMIKMSDYEFPLEVEVPKSTEQAHKLSLEIGPLIKFITLVNLDKYRRWHMIQRTPNEIIIYDVSNPGKQDTVDVLTDRIHREEGPVGS